MIILLCIEVNMLVSDYDIPKYINKCLKESGKPEIEFENLFAPTIAKIILVFKLAYYLGYNDAKGDK